MIIEHPETKENEFVEAKKSAFALPPIGRKQERAGPRQVPPVPPTPVPPVQPPPIKNSRARARLTGFSGQGCKVKLLDHAGEGVVQGQAPSGTKVGTIVEVIVEDDRYPNNLRLRWP